MTIKYRHAIAVAAALVIGGVLVPSSGLAAGQGSLNQTSPAQTQRTQDAIFDNEKPATKPTEQPPAA
jgi:hypothetical protein